MEVPDTRIVIGLLEIEPVAYRASLDGSTLTLTPTQVDVLTTLVINRDRVVTRNELASSANVEASSIDVVLSSLRRVLGDGFVRNVRNRGWILEPTAFEA